MAASSFDLKGIPTKEDILKLAKEHNVTSVRLQFTDILGVVKNVAIPVNQLAKALDDEIMFDGSSIQGYTRIEESDMNLRPDRSTFTLFPWRTSGEVVARLICDVYKADGTLFEGDPRCILKKVLVEAEEMGFEVNTGPECEFFMFKLDDNGRPTTESNDEAGYFDMGPLDKEEDARADIVRALEDMGFEVEAAHHEVALAQHEIDFKYDDALITADRVATFKFVTKTIAMQHDLHATFMPKPVYGINGSGMHTHISLMRNGKNAFYDPKGPYQLSEEALFFIGGLLRHAPAVTAITNPLVNSYKRLVPGYEAPVYISWSAHNRSALIRVPSSREVGTRAEFRSPDPSCNPYLAFAAMITAGLDGIKNKIKPPASMNKNIYHMTSEERAEAGIASLPGSLKDAVEALSQDEIIKSALGEHVYLNFIKAKRIEWDLYRTQVHKWELDQYLGVF